MLQYLNFQCLDTVGWDLGERKGIRLVKSDAPTTLPKVYFCGLGVELAG